MPQIQLAAKKEYQDIVNATFLFIETVTEGSDVYVIIYYENGRSEKQEIVSGSKFVQGVNDQKIWKVKFINPSLVTVDIKYRYSVVYGYDENTLAGNVTVTNDLSVNNYERARVLAGDVYMSSISPGWGVTTDITNGLAVESFAKMQLWNPAGSGKNLLIHEITALNMHISGEISTAYYEKANMVWNVTGWELTEAAFLTASIKNMNKSSVNVSVAEARSGAAGGTGSGSDYPASTRVSGMFLDLIDGFGRNFEQKEEFRHPLLVPEGHGLLCVNHHPVNWGVNANRPRTRVIYEEVTA